MQKSKLEHQTSSERRVRTAIVMGASVAGLWTARVLSDYFEKVLVLDRDALPIEPLARPGAPQARQYHILLLRGLQIMQELFPGLDEELAKQGAVPLDITGDLKTRSRGEWLEQVPSSQKLLSCSRLLLEANLRRRVKRIHSIEFIEGVEVSGLHSDSQRSAITGVALRRKDPVTQSWKDSEVLKADLIVDALGRRSATPQWLSAMGYAPPKETVINSYLGYVTRRYRVPDSIVGGWGPLAIGDKPPFDPYSGLIFPEENGTWVVMMAGVNKHYPPMDEAGFDAFARKLGPEFYAAVKAAVPIEMPYVYRGTESRWRHYEKLERWPNRFVVLGDAYCGFNPIYGQGMTVAALCAVALGDEIKRAGGDLDQASSKVRKLLTQAVTGAWVLATGADLAWPGTEGGSEKSTRLPDRVGRWYIEKTLDTLSKDHQVRMAFNEVNQLIKPLQSLFEPRIVLRVLAATSFRRGLERENPLSP
jgi:2-polyprenyl-6-methoxyphenol hydroxylase-like FAD-dependent oxidoreductase